VKKQDSSASGWVRQSIVLRLALPTRRCRTGVAAALAGIALAAAVLGSGSPASGALFTQAVNNDYANPLNWDTGAVPDVGNNQQAYIGTGTNAVYSTSTGYTTASRLLIGLSAASTLTMNGSAGTLTFGGDAYGSANYVGVDGGNGTLTATAGTLNLTGAGGAGVGGTLLVGANGGVSTGTVLVNGGTINVGTRIGLGTTLYNPPLSGAGNATLRIDSGFVNIGTGTNTDADKGYLYLKGTGTGDSGSATVTLNGGTLSLVQFYIGSGLAAKTINLNGGLIQARANNASFLNAGATVNVQSGGAILDTNGYSITVAAPMSGTGGLTKNGAGTLTLTGANAYAGNTIVNAGTLDINGSYTGSTGTTGSHIMMNPSGGASAALTVGAGAGDLTFAGNSYGYANDVAGNGNAGTAVMTLNGGAVSIGGVGSMRVGCNNSAANGTLIVNSGAALSIAAGRILIAANYSSATGTVTINGGSLILGTTGGYSYTDGDGLSSTLWMGGGYATVNINGGTLGLYGFNGGGANAVVNFNGGTVQVRNNNTTNYNFFNGTSFSARVQAGGAKFDTNGFNTTIPVALVHDSSLGSTPDGGLTKNGAGTLTLTAAETYTGTTTVSAGTLALSRSSTNNIPSSATIDIASGAFLNVNGLTSSTIVLNSQTLTGNGTLTGSLSFGAGSTIAAGNSPGLLSITGNYTQTGGTMAAEIGGTSPGSGYDQIAVGGTAALGGTVNVSTINGFMPQAGATFDILTAVGGISNPNLSGISFTYSGTMLPATYWIASIVDRSDLGANAEALRLTVGVPEPSSLVLAGVGLVGLALYGRRRRRA
jgi:fibronectin-binding autotransporter adhesin